jgi:hypothetical protein
MNKYLEKIAKEYSDERKSTNVGLGVGHFFTGGLATVAGSYVGTKPILNSIGKPGNVDKGTLRKVLKANKDLDVTFSSHKATKGTKYHHSEVIHSDMGPYFINKNHKDLGRGGLYKNYIHSGKAKNLDVIMHELGHAKAVKNGDYQLGSSKLPGHVMTGSGVGSLLLAHPATSGAAWVAPLASVVPMLRSEGLANKHAYNLIKTHGGKPMANKFLKGVAAKNMVGYASGAIANSAYLYGLHRLSKKIGDE